MSHTTLSLTKKLDGGYLHVKRRDSNVKKRVKGGYSAYLQGVKGSSPATTTIQTRKDKPSGNPSGKPSGNPSGNPSGKVIALKLGGKKPSPRKSRKSNKSKDSKEDEVKGIPTIIHTKKSVTIKGVTKEPTTIKVSSAKEPSAKEPSAKDHGIPIHLPVTKGSLKKKKINRRVRGTRGRSVTRRRNHDLRKGKRISVTKTRKLTDKDVSSIQSTLKDIKQKSSTEIKQELDKQGIQVSGKSPSILKDIYMYSQLCGITIKRE